ncbi:hypothetical protein [Croceicoccus sediminis]|uniref:hypothetical protein n=1 Tax=Croceicoccus sediminis TaxID=2571150 RepID=UPI0011841A5E|nr:hypothetical protein [Croceicoccus sediminis]
MAASFFGGWVFSQMEKRAELKLAIRGTQSVEWRSDSELYEMDDISPTFLVTHCKAKSFDIESGTHGNETASIDLYKEEPSVIDCILSSATFGPRLQVGLYLLGDKN